MSPTAECAAHTLSINLKANASFPAGRVSLVIAGQSPVVGRQEVLVVRISVPDRGDVAATTIEYDDGRVVVDRNEDGQVIGVEFSAGKSLGELPEFSALLARRVQDVALLRAAYNTAMFHWSRMKFFFDLTALVGPEVAKDRLRAADDKMARLQRAIRSTPEMVLWRSPTRDDRAALE